MSAIAYKNTKTTTPNFAKLAHLQCPRGYSYIQDKFFVHLYGQADGLWTISPALITTEQVNDRTLETWATQTFGAESIGSVKNPVGECISCVWRPGLYFPNERNQALEIKEHIQRADEQALRILITKLDELFLYIEPDTNGLASYSHKTRDLLISACTEIENLWTYSKTYAGRTRNTTDID